MIVQYWIGIPNRVNSLAKNSTNSSISQSYITLFITAIPWHSSLKDEGRLSWRPLSFQTSAALAFAGNGSLISVLLDDCSLFMEVYMAKRKLRAWTKKDIAELKAHSKSRTPVAKISKVTKRTVDALRRKAGIVGIRLGHRRDGRSRQKWSANRSRL